MGVPGKWGSCGGKVLPHGFETMNRDRSVWPSGTLITSCGVICFLSSFCIFVSFRTFSLLPPPSLPPPLLIPSPLLRAW